jgi:hypothetical protein
LNFILITTIYIIVLVFVFKSTIHIDLEMIPLELKYDTIINILGNFAIAIYIASIISKKQKNQELKIDNCFKELDSLLDLFSKLRNSIMLNNNTLEDDLIRYLALISLQIQLINKYNFISEVYKDKLNQEYYKLNTYLTEEVDEINKNYKHPLLQLEKIILNIKSNIL